MAIGGLGTWPLVAVVGYAIRSVIPKAQIAESVSLVVCLPIILGGLFLFFVGLVQNHKLHTNAYSIAALNENSKRCQECGGVCEKQYRKCRHCGSEFNELTR